MPKTQCRSNTITSFKINFYIKLFYFVQVTLFYLFLSTSTAYKNKNFHHYLHKFDNSENKMFEDCPKGCICGEMNSVAFFFIDFFCFFTYVTVYTFIFK